MASTSPTTSKPEYHLQRSRAVYAAAAGQTDECQVPGINAAFTASGAGLYGVTCQWQTNGVNLSGAANVALILTSVMASLPGICNVVVNDSGGPVGIVSSNANLYPVTAPVIISQTLPTNQVCIYGNYLSFAVTAAAPYQTSGFPLSYQWQLNGTNLGGATTSNHNFYATDASSGTYSVIVANAAGGESASWRVTVTNAINVTKDLLLFYNTNSADSAIVLNYYLAHRPMAGGASVLGIGCTNSEIIGSADFTNQILTPYLNWLTDNPGRHPQYLVLFLDIPSRVEDRGRPPWPGVQYQLAFGTPPFRPYVTSINMDGTNDCIGYINKLVLFGTNYSPGKLIISARAGGYADTNYVLDGIRNGPGFTEDDRSGDDNVVSSATNSLLAAGVSPKAIQFYDRLEILSNNIYFPLPHPTGMTNVAGYICWGAHSSLGGGYANNGAVQWNGHSAWWIIETIESFNGVRSGYGQGNFIQWFSSNAFGGTNYSNTPVGAVTHVEEPGLGGVENSAIYFGLWAGGKNFAICAWASRQTPEFQAVGDPLITK